MILIVLVLGFIVPVNYDSRLSCIIFVAINAICGALVYAVVSFKMGIIEKVLGKEMTNKILKKLTFGKVSI